MKRALRFLAVLVLLVIMGTAIADMSDEANWVPGLTFTP